MRERRGVALPYGVSLSQGCDWAPPQAAGVPAAALRRATHHRGLPPPWAPLAGRRRAPQRELEAAQVPRGSPCPVPVLALERLLGRSGAAASGAGRPSFGLSWDSREAEVGAARLGASSSSCRYLLRAAWWLRGPPGRPWCAAAVS